MSVRYVLTAVLPRYTMRRPNSSAPAALTIGPITDTPQYVDAQGVVSFPQSKGDYSEVVSYPVCGCGHRYDAHRDDGDPRGGGCWRCSCRLYAP